MRFLIYIWVGISMPFVAFANTTDTTKNPVYNSKKNNITISRDLEDESQNLNADLPDSLESISLDDLIVVDDSPKVPPPPPPQDCLQKPYIKDGKLTNQRRPDGSCFDPKTESFDDTPENTAQSPTQDPTPPPPQDDKETLKNDPSTAGQQQPAPEKSIPEQSAPEKVVIKQKPKPAPDDTPPPIPDVSTEAKTQVQSTPESPAPESPAPESPAPKSPAPSLKQAQNAPSPSDKDESITQEIISETTISEVLDSPADRQNTPPHSDSKITVQEQPTPPTETYEQSLARIANESDFFYTFGYPHKVFYPLPDPLPKPEPKISLLQSDTIGLYSPQSGGITKNYWQGYTYPKVLSQLQQADLSSRSFVYNKTMERVILTGVPVPKQNAKPGDIFAFRVQSLMDAGRLLDARKLLYTLPYDMRVSRYADQLARIYMAFFDNASLCGLYYGQSDMAKTQPFWERTHILCLTLDGNIDRIDTALKSLNTPLPEGMKELVEFGLKGTDIPQNINIDINIWTVHLIRSLGFGVDVPVDADMPSYYGLLQNLAVPDDQRAYYVYALFKQGSAPLSLVDVVYQTVSDYIPRPDSNQMPFDVAIEPYITDIRYANMAYYLRALSYQTALKLSQQHTSQPNAHTDLLIQTILDQIHRETSYEDRMTTIRIFAPLLAKVPVYTHPKSKKIAGILYASGYYDTANTWAEAHPMELWYERTLYQVLQSAPTTNHNQKHYDGHKGACTTTPINPSDWMKYIQTTDPDNAIYRISEAFMTLETFGCTIGSPYWQQLADMTPLLVQNSIAPAHIRILRITYDRAVHALPVVLAIKSFVNRVDISHMEMAKIYTLLYNTGYARLAAQIAFERNTYNPW